MHTAVRGLTLSVLNLNLEKRLLEQEKKNGLQNTYGTEKERLTEQLPELTWSTKENIQKRTQALQWRIPSPLKIVHK